ncbi:uncharacterized protein LOC106153517 isoform X3 [Lingula anatina]|uniref:Uncharacterized protein LOC106153517 isoform X3 n=1 Tax=Lingula anatina TaxID=7574 RepID=A0A1S3HBP5_LINAN|nr:uncharacterized protein LOC106153517 isoform X3 [Lingula anatina]|eukprot:XP_013382946.1 uncharacterized protein LOC106153517 isoform X3 [Lingula anatina]
MAGPQVLIFAALLGCAFAPPPIVPPYGPAPAPSVYSYRWSVNPPAVAYTSLTPDEAEAICKECKPLGSGLGGYFAVEGDPIHYIRCVPQGDSWQVFVLHCCNHTSEGGYSTEWFQEYLACDYGSHPNPYTCEGFKDVDPPVPPQYVPFWPLQWTPKLDSLVEDRDYGKPGGVAARVYTGVYDHGNVKKGSLLVEATQETVPTIVFDGQKVGDTYAHIEVPFFENADWSQYSPGFSFTFGFCIDANTPLDAALITNADCNFTASVEISLQPNPNPLGLLGQSDYLLQALIRSQGNSPDTISTVLPLFKPPLCYFAGFSYTQAGNKMLLWRNGNVVTGTAQGPPRRINQNPLFIGYSCYGYPDQQPPRALHGSMSSIKIWGDKALDAAQINQECVDAKFCNL